MTLVQLFTAIANAIRTKKGTSETIKAEDFPTEIADITTGHLDNEEYETSNDKLDEILEGTEVPTGTKQISITQNGTTTEDVTNYANAQITTNVVNQDYEDALVAFGVTEDLADGIEALTTYSNEVTGESDTTLSNAVRTLANGYGGGGGLEYETGTYIPTVNEQPTIYFTNVHSTAPSIIIFEDVSAETATINETCAFIYVNSLKMFGAPLLVKAEVFYNEFMAHIKKNANGNITSNISEYTRGEITASSFIPYAATNYNYPAGHTLKWIAIWL